MSLFLITRKTESTKDNMLQRTIWMAQKSVCSSGQDTTTSSTGKRMIHTATIDKYNG